MLLNKTDYYQHIKLKEGLAAVKKGGMIPIELIKEECLMCLDLNVWEILN